MAFTSPADLDGFHITSQHLKSGMHCPRTFLLQLEMTERPICYSAKCLYIYNLLLLEKKTCLLYLEIIPFS